MGVKEGRKRSVGKRASSKTGPRPVCVRMVCGNRGRKSARMFRPRVRCGVDGSSSSVKRGGMNKFQFSFMILS